MREEFEKWYDSPQDDMGLIPATDLNKAVEIVAWSAWQASRAALVVDMTVHEQFDKRMYASNVYKELDKAGIKYE